MSFKQLLLNCDITAVWGRSGSQIRKQLLPYLGSWLLGNAVNLVDQSDAKLGALIQSNSAV